MTVENWQWLSPDPVYALSDVMNDHEPNEPLLARARFAYDVDAGGLDPLAWELWDNEDGNKTIDSGTVPAGSTSITNTIDLEPGHLYQWAITTADLGGGNPGAQYKLFRMPTGETRHAIALGKDPSAVGVVQDLVPAELTDEHHVHYGRSLSPDESLMEGGWSNEVPGVWEPALGLVFADEFDRERLPAFGEAFADTFDRVVSGGWGGEWTQSGGWMSCDGARALFSLNGPNNYGFNSVVTDYGWPVEALVACVWPEGSYADGSMAVEAYLNDSGDASGYYRVGVSAESNGDVRVYVYRNSTGGGFSSLHDAVALPGAVPNGSERTVWLRLGYTAENRLQVRVWLDGMAEPSTWVYDETDPHTPLAGLEDFELRGRNGATISGSTQVGVDSVSLSTYTYPGWGNGWQSDQTALHVAGGHGVRTLTTPPGSSEHVSAYLEDITAGRHVIVWNGARATSAAGWSHESLWLYDARGTRYRLQLGFTYRNNNGLFVDAVSYVDNAPTTFQAATKLIDQADLPAAPGEPMDLSYRITYDTITGRVGWRVWVTGEDMPTDEQPVAYDPAPRNGALTVLHRVERSAGASDMDAGTQWLTDAFAIVDDVKLITIWADYFDRVVVGGWGGDWVQESGALSVDGNHGLHTNTDGEGTVVTASIDTTGPTLTNTGELEFLVAAYLPDGRPLSTGALGQLYVFGGLRGTATDFWRFGFELMTDGRVLVAVVRANPTPAENLIRSSAGNILPENGTGPCYVLGRFHIDFATQTVQGKAWMAGTDEPADYQFSGTATKDPGGPWVPYANIGPGANVANASRIVGMDALAITDPTVDVENPDWWLLIRNRLTRIVPGYVPAEPEGVDKIHVSWTGPGPT